MDVDKHKQALAKMGLKQLREAALTFDPPIELKWNDTRPRIVKKIIEREQQESERKSDVETKPATSVKSNVNTEFEAAAAAVTEPPKVDRRGGAGRGQGRPLGLTDEKAAVKNLPKQPNMAIRQGVYVLGQAWAASVKIPAVAFNDEETDLLALPLSQLQEFYFPGLIPEIAAVWVSLAYGIAKVVKVRVDLINEVRKARKEGTNVERIIRIVDGRTDQNHTDEIQTPNPPNGNGAA
jgi:hypothetical protein